MFFRREHVEARRSEADDMAGAEAFEEYLRLEDDLKAAAAAARGHGVDFAFDGIGSALATGGR